MKEQLNDESDQYFLFREKLRAATPIDFRRQPAVATPKIAELRACLLVSGNDRDKTPRSA